MNNHLEIEKEVSESLKYFVNSEKPSVNLKAKILEATQQQTRHYVRINRPLKRSLFAATLLIALLVGSTIYAAPYLGQSVKKLFDINHIPIFSTSIDTKNSSSIDHDLSIDESMNKLLESTKVSRSEIQKLSPVKLNLPTYLPKGYKFASDFGREGVVTWDVEKNTVSHKRNREIEYTAYFDKVNIDASNNTVSNDEITLTYRYDPNFTYSNGVGIPDVISTEKIKGFQVVVTINSLDTWIPMDKGGVLRVILSTNSNSLSKNERMSMLTSIINQLSTK